MPLCRLTHRPLLRWGAQRVGPISWMHTTVISSRGPDTAWGTQGSRKWVPAQNPQVPSPLSLVLYLSASACALLLSLCCPTPGLVFFVGNFVFPDHMCSLLLLILTRGYIFFNDLQREQKGGREREVNIDVHVRGGDTNGMMSMLQITLQWQGTR